MVHPALLLLMRTPRLPVVDWIDAPADLNGLVRFAEKRKVVSARVPSHFKRSLTNTFCRMGGSFLVTKTFALVNWHKENKTKKWVWMLVETFIFTYEVTPSYNKRNCCNRTILITTASRWSFGVWFIQSVLVVKTCDPNTWHRLLLYIINTTNQS